MQNFPFSRGAPSGIDYILGQRVFPEALNTIDKNAAQAADGNIWSDQTALRNFTRSTRTTGSDQAIFQDSYTNAWIHAYTSAVDTPVVDMSMDGREDWIALTPPAAGSNWFRTWSGAAKGNGTIVLGGGGSAASAVKIRQTANGGQSWANRNTVASGTEQVACLGFDTVSGLFVAGLNSAAASNIETSSDGVAWTQRTGLGNSDARASVAFGNGMMIMTSGSNVARVLKSTNGGVTWVSVAMPSSAVWRSVAFSALLGKFMALGSGNAIATSVDGNAWTNAGLSNPITGGVVGLVSIGRCWLAGGAVGALQTVLLSFDGGVTWQPVKQTPLPIVAMAADARQAMLVGYNVAYSSLRIG